MPLTAKRSYPYPTSSAAPDVPLDLETLAKALDTDVSTVAAAAAAASSAAADANTAAAAGAWRKRDLTASDDLDLLVGTANLGQYRVNSTSVKGLPMAALGHVTVLANGTDGRTVHIFTRSAPGAVEQTARVHSSGVWGDWSVLGWRGGFVAIGTDFDTLRTPGIYPVQSTTHPNQPVPTIGTLEVLPASALVSHRYTTWEAKPRVLQRRATTATAWGDWDEPNALAAQALAMPTRAALVAAPISTASKAPALIVAELSADRLTGWNWTSSSVSETTDDGATWRQLNDSAGANPFSGSQVESVLYLANDELLITCTRGLGEASRREVWVTRNLRDDTARTFTKTMTARAYGIKFTSSWSQDTHGKLVLLNEYGPKTGAQWGGVDVAPGANARYTYLSTDYGQTWRIIFDLNTYLTGTQGNASTDHQHLHGVAWDPWWDRVWVSFGDNSGGAGSNGVVYSDDLGATWKTAHYYKGPEAPNQLVGIVPMPKCVLFGGDNGSPDVIRISRAQGKRRSVSYSLDVAFDSTAPGKHLLQGKTRIDRVGGDAPALLAFCAEGADSPSFAVATLDGWTFLEFWRDPVNQAGGFGARTIVGPTLRGQVIISSHDQKVDGAWTQITTAAPGY